MKKSIIALALSSTLVLGCAIGANAAAISKTIQATLDPGIKVSVNNELKVLADDSGKEVYPILYEGTTYLPVRAISKIAGYDVGWDANTRTVSLNGTTDADIQKGLQELESLLKDPEAMKEISDSMKGLFDLFGIEDSDLQGMLESVDFSDLANMGFNFNFDDLNVDNWGELINP